MFSGGGGSAPPPARQVQAEIKAEPVKATSEEAQTAANTRARRRMGSRLLFSQERSAGLGMSGTPLGGGSGEGKNTLS
jgi:hypothetical protein